jgi:phosphatidate cytidylyltransferase
MLKQRIITALLMLAILLPALFYPRPEPFAVVALLMVSAAGWEWGRLNGAGAAGAFAVGGACLLLCALAWYSNWLAQPHLLLWCVAGAAWVLGGSALLRAGVAGWPRVSRPLRLLGGVLALWVTWLAVVQARAMGINFLLSVLMLIWVADVFAYFAGRAFGLRFTKGKLAPSISPGKSWEGVWGGMAGVVALGAIWAAADRYLGVEAASASFYTRLLGGSWLLLLLACLFMASMSVVGDLTESLIKRSAGAKDSSNLLPGHGGVLDRVDALLPTLPLALMLVQLVSA